VSVQVWVRLGGTITVSKENLALIQNDDPSVNVDAIILDAVKRNGFEANGDSYAPVDDDDDDLDGLMDNQFDFDISAKLVFKDEG
jgi:hypothetical protein